MSKEELIKEALNFKGSGRYKKHNQLDKWKDIIEAMKTHDFSVKSILEFILTKDKELLDNYKDRESTLYSLLCKYIQKLDLNNTQINKHEKETIVTKKATFDIESEKIKYGITDEEEKEIRKKYGDQIVNKYGLIFAKSTAGM